MLRSALCVMALCVPIVVSGCKTSDDNSGVLDSDQANGRLGVIGHARIDGKELSGMAARRSAAVGTELLIISDVSYRVSSIGFKDNFASDQFFYDLKNIIPGFYSKSDSQWEAIAADKSRVFIMRENPGEVFVFSGDLKTFLQAIILKIPKSSPLHAAWTADPNSRGEGMILLKNGHILVIKEKDPVQLIEFGPQNDLAEGFKPGEAVGMDENFPLPVGTEVEFFPLKYWDVGNDSNALISDVSDLAVGPDGKIYALSDKDSRIAALENVLKPTETKFKVKASWTLSDKVAKPEGLVITSSFEPLVTSDDADIGRNLFYLRPMY